MRYYVKGAVAEKEKEAPSSHADKQISDPKEGDKQVERGLLCVYAVVRAFKNDKEEVTSCWHAQKLSFL